jgi:hypothetical protein
MPVETHFSGGGRAIKAPASIKKKVWQQIALQRKTGTAPETTEQKNPQLCWDCIIFSTALKKWWQKELLLTTTHWPLAIKLSAFIFHFLSLTVSHILNRVSLRFIFGISL